MSDSLHTPCPSAWTRHLRLQGQGNTTVTAPLHHCVVAYCCTAVQPGCPTREPARISLKPGARALNNPPGRVTFLTRPCFPAYPGGCSHTGAHSGAGGEGCLRAHIEAPGVKPRVPSDTLSKRLNFALGCESGGCGGRGGCVGTTRLTRCKPVCVFARAGGRLERAFALQGFLWRVRGISRGRGAGG